MNDFEKFWKSVESFPIGLYCNEFHYDWRMEKLPKDCATCTFLRLGKCSRKKVPTIKREEGE